MASKKKRKKTAKKAKHSKKPRKVKTKMPDKVIAMHARRLKKNPRAANIYRTILGS